MSGVAPPNDLERVPTLLGRDIAAMSHRERARWLNYALIYWRMRGFPYPFVTDELIASEMCRLRAVHAEHLSTVLARPSMVGLRTANSFHPQMWSARVRGRSPLECFANDEILRRCLERAVRYWPDRRCWNGRSIRILVSIQNRSRVSNFRPTVARALIDVLCENGGSILDFSAGYGGRLLAAISLSRDYMGIDPAQAQCHGLRQMASKLGSGAQIVAGCAEDIMEKLPDRSFNLVFTSPPYFRLERYANDTSQSFKRYPRYDWWLSGFLTPVLEHSRRVLVRNGWLALNVSNLTVWPIATDAASIAEQFFGSVQRVHDMAMSTNPADKARRGKLLRSEPILIYRR
jgi:16S rRNA G966 N2-methylase RsmD